MIWFTLALFAVSFVLTALLAPKPELEDARPEGLDSDNFPKATEDAPVPLLLGCAKIKGPNTLWYGNFESVPIKESVKSGLFSSTTVIVGYEYFLSIDLGLCLGPATLKEIYIDSVPTEPGVEQTVDVDFEFVNEDGGGNTNWSGSSFNFQSGSVTFTENYGIPPATSGRGFTEFDLVTDLGLSVENIDGGALTWEQSIGSNFVSGISSDNMDLFSRVRFYDGSGNKLTVAEGAAAETAEASYDQGIGIQALTFSVTIPSGARTAEVQVWHTVLFPIFSGQAFGDHRITVTGTNLILTEQNFDISKPELYGGFKSGGGHVGNVDFYPGTFTQTVNSHVEAAVGAGNVPAYRGICHMVWKNHNIGESASLRGVEFLLASYSNNLGNGNFGAISSGGDDIDPAEAIYEILTNSWRGLGLSADDVDFTTFTAASTTLISEGHGCSLVVSSAQTGKKVITEILRQIDGILYQDTSTGKIKIKLIRDDYTPASLPVYDEDDIVEVTRFSKTAWEDVKSQVKVSFPSRTKDSSIVAIAQNGATANMLGQLRTADVSFPFCYDKNIANQLAARELSVLSTPLFTMQAEFNRNAYNLEPGEVIKISWPEYGLTEVIMRVQKIDIGSLLDGRIVVDMIQDVFAISDVVLAAPEDTSWVDDRPVPETVDTYDIVEMPYFFSNRLEYPVPDGNADVIPFALQPKVESTAYTFLSGGTTGDLSFYEPTAIEYPLTGQLVGIYAENTGFETGLDATGITVDGLTGPNTDTDAPGIATTAQLRTGEAGLIYIGGEWLGYEGVTDNLDGSYTLANVRRGLLGTRPLAHADNARVWFLTIDLLGEGSKAGELAEDGTLYFKLLDRVGGTLRSSGSETEQSFALGDIADRPLRPRLLSIDGARTEVPWDASYDPTVNMTWETSNRASSQIAFEDDTDETPDQTEQYDLEVWVDGVQDMSLSDDNITQPYALDVSTASGSVGELRLYSKRTGGDTKRSVYYAKYPFTLSRATMDSTTVTMDDSGTTMDQTS